MSASTDIVGRLVVHPRRQDRLCVARGRTVLASFGRDEDRATVTAILRANGYAVRSDLTVISAPIAAQDATGAV